MASVREVMTGGAECVREQETLVHADDDAASALRAMTDRKVRRLPVLDGDRLVGVVSQADVAVTLPHDRVGELVESISSVP